VCNFSVATSEEWLDKATKQKKQKVEWHNISSLIFVSKNSLASSSVLKAKKRYKVSVSETVNSSGEFATLALPQVRNG
jgi:fructose-specific component phosphotransferase system IIB-like protein